MFALRRVIYTYSLKASCYQARLLHISSPALKKKTLAKKVVELEEDDSEFFSFDAGDVEDTFSVEPEVKPKPPGVMLVNEKGLEISGMQSALFDALCTKTLANLQKRPKRKQPPRKSTFSRLIALSQSKDDLEKILHIINVWRSQPPNLHVSEQFFGRCTRLGYPEVALKALQSRTDYGMDLSSLSAARRLLHALSQPRQGYDLKQLLMDCLALAELYPVYGYPPASKDVVSCAIIASALSHRLPKRIDVKDEGAVGISPELKAAWSAILIELEQAAAAWETQAPTLNPKTAHWMRGCLSNIVRTFQGVKNSTPWVGAFREALRSVGSPHHPTRHRTKPSLV